VVDVPDGGGNDGEGGIMIDATESGVAGRGAVAVLSPADGTGVGQVQELGEGAGIRTGTRGSESAERPPNSWNGDDA